MIDAAKRSIAAKSLVAAGVAFHAAEKAYEDAKDAFLESAYPPDDEGESKKAPDMEAFLVDGHVIHVAWGTDVGVSLAIEV